MDIKLKYRAYVGEKHPDIASKLIDSDIERFTIEFSEHLLEQLRQYNVVGQSEQLPCGHKQVELVRHAAKCKDCGTVFETKW